MAQAAAFRWDKRARLFAGANQIVRPTNAGPKIFTRIVAQPTSATLSNLGAALIGTCGFCVSEQTLPPELHTDPEHFLTLTGGSSAKSKIIRRTQASWIASFAVNANRFGLTSDDSVAVFGNLSHSLALYGVLEALHLGLNAHALDGMRPKTQRATVVHHDITVLYATPTQLRLLAHQAMKDTLPAVRLILCGGGHLDQPTQQATKELCPKAVIHVFYGASETSFVTLSDGDTPAGSVGQPYPDVTLRILDAGDLPTTDVGEVWVKSPYLFERYVSGTSNETRRKDGFVTVGEMGQIDASGNLWLRGRKARMVTIADQNVFPEDIETLLSSCPQFAACAVIPVSDRTRGHRLIAVLQGGQDAKIAHAVKDKCRAKFGALMTPSKVLFHPSLPLLTSGKVDLITLSNWVEDQL